MPTTSKWALGAIGVTLLCGLIFFRVVLPNLPESFSGSWVTIIAVATLAIATVYGAYKDDSKPTGAIAVSWVVKAVAVIVAALILMFGWDGLKNPAQQGLFDGNRPNAMGWTNINGDFIVVPGLTPHDCVPSGHDAFDANGNIFPFHSTEDRGNKACYKNGIALIPNSQEDTPDVSGLTPQGVISKLTTTPAERKAEEAAEQEKIDAAHKRRIGLYQAKNPPIDYPLVDPDGCTGNYANQINCKRVTLHASAGDKLDWSVDKSTDSRTRCIQFNPSSQLQTSLLRNDSDEPVGITFTFTGNGQMTYTIFEVPVGQTGPGGARCGS